MARTRAELDEKLCDILDDLEIPKTVDGEHRLYFQPPANIQMEYPCIVYNLSTKNVWKANNSLYQLFNIYNITVIDEDPDSEIPDSILRSFDYCSFDRQYASEGLNHSVLTIYF